MLPNQLYLLPNEGKKQNVEIKGGLISGGISSHFGFIIKKCAKSLFSIFFSFQDEKVYEKEGYFYVIIQGNIPKHTLSEKEQERKYHEDCKSDGNQVRIPRVWPRAKLIIRYPKQGW